ncbi:MAG: holo-ACP synthase [Candidatus Desulforudis sp.]|nr:holo-ACP synthase [Desulforudis sp.]
MISGIGTDLVSVTRIRRVVERTDGRFLLRVFTPAERDFCRMAHKAYECFAARFAAKEAVFKALGTGLAGCRWQDVEVLNDPGGRPVVVLSGGAALAAGRRGVSEVHISLSHDGDQALAFAVAVGTVPVKGEG